MATATRSGQRISGNGSTSNGDALGLIETKGLVGMIEATDAMLKTLRSDWQTWQKQGYA